MIAWIRLSTACILMFATVSAADWATWLGPNRDGKSLETGLLKSWPEGGPKVVWKAGGLGEGYSSMAVVGNRIYTQGQEGDAQFVIALDSSNGKQAALDFCENKELSVVPGTGHVDLYDRINLIPFQKLAQFFQENLNEPN